MTLFQGGQLEVGRCLSLLARSSIGRVGIVIGPLPFVYPVRYDMSNGHILFVLSIDQVATAIDDAVVALQADGFDEDRGRRWTVLAIGPATAVEPTSESVPRHLRPDRHAFRLRPKMISGHWLDQAGDDG
jgi:nitroimidazol reductase NimA-like FMN-containing flavoprotein (pyridoxamine 5'-phosphate oxidase superfamily)